MEPLEGLLQRKGKAPELVTVYKMEMMLLNGWVDEVLCLLYSAADGVPALLVPSTEERIVFNRPHSGREWKIKDLETENYRLLRDTVDGWLPMKDGWEVSEDGDSIRVAKDNEVSVFFMGHDTGKAYLSKETSNLNLVVCGILKPII